MDFFFSPDWLNREGPKYAFKLDHILFVVLGLLIGVLLCFLLRKKDKKVIKMTCISIWALAVLVELLYYGVNYVMCIVDPSNYPFDIETMLPFHSCLMFLYVFLWQFFLKIELLRQHVLTF